MVIGTYPASCPSRSSPGICEETSGCPRERDASSLRLSAPSFPSVVSRRCGARGDFLAGGKRVPEGSRVPRRGPGGLYRALRGHYLRPGGSPRRVPPRAAREGGGGAHVGATAGGRMDRAMQCGIRLALRAGAR